MICFTLSSTTFLQSCRNPTTLSMLNSSKFVARWSTQYLLNKNHNHTIRKHFQFQTVPVAISQPPLDNIDDDNGDDDNNEDEDEDENEDEDDQVMENQWDQHAHRDVKSYERQRAAVQTLSNRQRHFHVFLQPASIPIFKSAVTRFLSSLSMNTSVSSQSPDTCMEQNENKTNQTNRLWILQVINDPTFGEIQVEPHPPRCVIVTCSSYEQTLITTKRWVDGLDRSGNVLSPMPSHYVDWAMCSGHYQLGYKHLEMRKGWLVIFEILNTNWVKPKAVDDMRDVLVKHGQRMVESGYIKSYEVFQSIKEPTCFKTIEVYENLDQLKTYVKEKDKQFEKDAEVHRAAVYRVRQLHHCLGTL